jgi:hypothetical protein
MPQTTIKGLPPHYHEKETTASGRDRPPPKERHGAPLGSGRFGVLLLTVAALAGGIAAPPAEATVSPQQIDAFLLAQGSPLVGEGAAFYAAGQRYGVDPAFLVAIAGAESSFGQDLFFSGSQTASYNAFNWFYAPTRIGSSFASWDQAITTVAQGLSGPLYYGAGRYSVSAIAPIYCPQGTQDWISNVTTFMLALGADPNDTRWQGATAATASDPQPDATAPADANDPTPAVLVIERPITIRPSTVVAFGQHLRIVFTLVNAGQQAGSWSALTLRLRGPSGQTLVYDSNEALTLPAGGRYACSASLVPSVAGTWRAWISIQASDGTILSEAQPTFCITVRQPSRQTQPAQRNTGAHPTSSRLEPADVGEAL